MVRTDSTVTVAQVGDDIITGQEYYNEARRLRATLNELVDPSMIKELKLFNVALGQMVSEKLVELESRNIDLAIGDETLKHFLSTDSQFANTQGLFDRSVFEQRLRQLRMNEQQYLNATRHSLEQYITQQTVAPDQIYDDTLMKVLGAIEEEEREALLFVVNEFEGEISTPGSETLRDFYEDNKARYMAPEFRVLQYVVLDKDVVSDAISISEEELQDTYFTRQDELSVPEKRDVSQLLYMEKAQAENAYAKLRAGDSLADVASAIPPVNSETLSLGEMTKSQLPAAQDTIFSLEKNGFTSPVETDFGWHVFYVNDIRPKTVPSFDEMKATLKKEMQHEQTVILLGQLVEQLEDAIAAGLDIKDISTSINAPLELTDAIDSAGRQSDGTQYLDKEAYFPLIASGFGTAEGQISDIGRLDDGSYFVVKPIEVTPPRQRALQEVQGQVAAHWKAQEKARKVNTYIKEINAKLTGVTSADAAKEILQAYDVELTTRLTTKRNGVISSSDEFIAANDVPSDVITAIFAASSNNRVIDSVAYADGRMGAVFLTARQSSDERSTQRLNEISQRLRQTLEQEVGQLYLNKLRERFPVTYDAQAIQQIAEQL